MRICADFILPLTRCKHGRIGGCAEPIPPTDEGKRRYPPDGYYIANVEPGECGTPCTCKPSCPWACKGECGCEACHEGYGDFLSVE